MSLVSVLSGVKTVIADQSDANKTVTIAPSYIKNRLSFQSNWTQTDTTALDYIKNKPFLPTTRNVTFNVNGGLERPPRR